MEQTTQVIMANLSLCISLLALTIATLNFRRKSGVLIRGSYTVSSGHNCDDMYVSSVTLENLKDRAVTVFGIYLKLGPNYFIELENFKMSPLILKPYETYQREYDSIEFYNVNLNRINMNNLFEDERVKRQLTLSTSGGEYKVSSWVSKWDPTFLFFNNHMTATIIPIYSSYKGVSLGANMKYVIEFEYKDSKPEIIPIHPNDYQVKKFHDFRITKEALETKESLTLFLESLLSQGTLKCERFKVHDLNIWRKRQLEIYSDKVVDAVYVSNLHYSLVGPLWTKYSNMKLWWSNKQLNKKNKKSLQSDDSK